MKFIGLANKDEVDLTISQQNWQFVAFGVPPYSVVRPAPTYLTTLGSGSYSLPTTSIYGYNYISGIDVFRQDYLNGCAVIDVDHYIAVPYRNIFQIYSEPPGSGHHLEVEDRRIFNFSSGWQHYFRLVLSNKIRG